MAGDDDRDAQGAESDWRSVGDQAQAGGVQRVEAQAHQQSGGNGYRCAETCRTFEEGAEAETDQQHLQALVIGDRQHRAADHFELAALDRQFVEEHRRDDDPGDRPQAIGKTVSGGGKRHVGGHLEGEDRYQDRQTEGDAAGDVALEPEHCQSEEEEHDRDDCRERGQAKTTKRTVELLPGLHMGWPLIVVGQHWHWIIGKTNLQCRGARLKASLWVCQFVPRKLSSDGCRRTGLSGSESCNLMGVGRERIGQNRRPRTHSGLWRACDGF
ncbi:hypothetical protein D9M71_317550 [compost metagenome]